MNRRKYNILKEELRIDATPLHTFKSKEAAFYALLVLLDGGEALNKFKDVFIEEDKKALENIIKIHSN